MARYCVALCIAMLALMVAPAAIAAPAQDDLSAQLPDTTYFYVSIRTDAAYFDTLDSVLARFHPTIRQLNQLDAGLPPSGTVNMTTLLDLLAASSLGTDFANNIRPWLGDSIALAVYDQTDAPEQGVIAIRITDRAAAEDFVRQALPPDARPDVSGGFNIYGDQSTGDGVFAISDDVMYFASTVDAIPFETSLADSLKQNPGFSAAINSLPSTNYNITGYVDLATLSAFTALAINNTFNSIMGELDPGAEQPPEPELIIGPPLDMAFGATIKDERTLIFDTAINGVENYIAGVDLPLFAGAVNAEFAQYLPANTALLVHGADLQTSINQIFALTRITDPSFDSDLAEIDNLVNSLIGMNLSTDILSLLELDYAAYVTLDTADNGLPSALNALLYGGEVTGFGFGVVIKNTNPTNGDTLIDGVQQLLPMLGLDASDDITVTTGRVAGVEEAIIITLDGASQGLPATLEIVIAANDDVIVFATRDEAEIALTGSGTLAEDASYRYARETFLGNTTGVLYMDQAGISTVGSTVLLALLGPVIGDTFEDIFSELSNNTDGAATFYRAQDGEDPIGQILNIYAGFIGVFDSMVITTASTDDSLLLRFVINFSE